jgi:SAM-dependent methyltransferase
MPDPESPYSRLNYRRLIAWPARIEREWPFLAATLAGAPARSVIDLGCGTGEHARFLAGNGFRAVGLDRSEAQIGQARDYEGESGERGPSFLLGEISDLPRLTEERFGGAICLGNVLPHLDDDQLGRAFTALASRVLAGGRLVVQVINYERIFGRGIRALPINFRADPERPGGEIAFVRLMTVDGDRHVRFYPLTLALLPDEEPAIELKAAREVRLRAWRLPELTTVLEASGFELVACHGDMVGGAYEAEESPDLVVVAQRA